MVGGREDYANVNLRADMCVEGTVCVCARGARRGQSLVQGRPRGVRNDSLHSNTEAAAPLHDLLRFLSCPDGEVGIGLPHCLRNPACDSQLVSRRSFPRPSCPEPSTLRLLQPFPCEVGSPGSSTRLGRRKLRRKDKKRAQDGWGKTEFAGRKRSGARGRWRRKQEDSRLWSPLAPPVADLIRRQRGRTQRSGDFAPRLCGEAG